MTETLVDSSMMHDLISQYEQMHQAGHFGGRALADVGEIIGLLIRDTASHTILDYGSGKGEAYTVYGLQRDWGVEVTCYDPAVPGFKTRPKQKFDGVICNDVMEHIPEDHVPMILRDVLGFAGKFAFFQICTRKAKKNLPDGRNCHLTIKNSQWWIEQIDQARAVVGGPEIIRVVWHLEERERIIDEGLERWLGEGGNGNEP